MDFEVDDVRPLAVAVVVSRGECMNVLGGIVLSLCSYNESHSF